jgi:hypothetical protein
MSSRTPAAVVWIVWLNRIRVAMSVIATVLSIYFISPADSEMVEAFRRGWVRSTGFTLEEYGPEQAGEVAGMALVPLALSLLILYFVRRRKLKALQVAAAVNFIMSLTQPLTWPITLTTVILASRKSTRDYLEEVKPAPAARPTRPPARVAGRPTS